MEFDPVESVDRAGSLRSGWRKRGKARRKATLHGRQPLPGCFPSRGCAGVGKTPAFTIALALAFLMTASVSPLSLAKDRADTIAVNTTDYGQWPAPAEQPLATGFAHAVRVAHDRAYVALGPDGLAVIDVSDPDHPALLGRCPVGNAIDVRHQGDYAYVATDDAGLQIVDVHEPEHPEVVGVYETAHPIRGLDLAGAHVFLGLGSGGVEILDVSPASAPRRIARQPTQGLAGRVHLERDHLYVAEGPLGFEIFSIANLAGPEFFSWYPFPAYDLGVDCAIACVTDVHQGLVLVTVGAPHEVAPPGVDEWPEFRQPRAVRVTGGHIYAVGSSNRIAVVEPCGDIGRRDMFATPARNLQNLDVQAPYTYLADGEWGLRIVSLRIGRRQTLVWNTPAKGTLGLEASYHLVATASSGLPVSFSLLEGPAVLSGSELTLTALGTVRVLASQAGDDTWSPVSEVRTFSIVNLLEAQLNEDFTVTIMGGCTEGTINIPETMSGWRVVAIGDSAFSGCEGLAGIRIPTGVNYIGTYAFYGCRSLGEVHIPSSVLSIGESAFAGCSRLAAFEVDPTNPAFSSADGVLFDKDQKTLIECPKAKGGDYAVPFGVTTIRDGAFAGCAALTGVTIAEGVSRLGNSAFSGCSQLVRIVLPPSVAEIEYHAFQGCSNLLSVDVDSRNPFFLSADGVLFTRSGAEIIAYPRGRFGDYAIPQGTRAVRAQAFEGCRGLTNIIVPDGVTELDWSAFRGCDGLLYVKLPDSLLKIGGGAFEGCSRLQDVRIPDSGVRLGDYAFAGCRSLTRLAIPPSATFDGTSVFTGCAALTYVVVGEGITRIGNGAFSGCTDLRTLELPRSVTSIGNGAFGSSGLTRIEIPNTVNRIEPLAFQSCADLVEVTLPNTVTTIEGGTFAGCTKLAAIEIPASVDRIEISAFAGCSGLTHIDLACGLLEIGEGAFTHCVQLGQVVVPASVVRLENAAFAGCTGLTHVYFEGDAPQEREADTPGLMPFHDTPATLHYLPGTAGWGPTFDGRPCVPWVRPNPTILDFGDRFGPSPSGFGFVISWSTIVPVVVEASSELVQPTWTPISTHTLTDGWVVFTDPDWSHHPARFYRVRAP